MIYVAIVAGVVFIDCGERRIPVQYAKRVVGRKMYGGQSTNIPMKVHSAGVMPIIFAVTLLQFPGMIASFWPQSGFAHLVGPLDEFGHHSIQHHFCNFDCCIGILLQYGYL